LTEPFVIGLTNVLAPHNLLAIIQGTIIGLFVGAMPGLSSTMAIALLVPLTFGMPPETGLSRLASLYLATMYGGSISATLIRTPGTPAAAATVLDGHPMAARGQAGAALGVSLVASFVGGLIASIFFLLIAPVLGRIVLEFGPVELFSVAVVGLTIVASLAQGAMARGLLSGALGLLLGCVGMDVTTGTPRFHFGVMDLYEGIPFLSCIIGLFSIPQALRLIQSETGETRSLSRVAGRMLPKWPEFMRLLPNILRSSLIGIFVGLVPGTGGDKAAFFAYNEAKRFSKIKDQFGTGIPDGVAAPESANNAVVAGALIPTITLGIPGSGSCAVLMGALLGHGILPGPNLMTDHAKIVSTLI
jgi:putative tricarboxylic transport membrane protein